ncbi:MAG: FAD binding domain-containing protein [Chloroflexi bacterium]|nr:FAD binding domain-containing protein [Chloroflexota bacterium]
MLRPFRIHQPATVDDTVQLLGRFGEEATVYAGGTELLLAMKEGLLSYAHLLDVKNVDGLGQISYNSSEQSLRIGSAVTHRSLETSAEVLREFPLIAEVEKTVANVRVRNVGTLGGNLCFAEPHSDPAALLLLYDARVESKGSRGSRTFPLEELTLGPYETCLEEDEVLVGVVVPQLPAGMTGTYLKFGYHARPTLGLGVALRLDRAPGVGSDGFQELQSASIQEVRVSVGSVGPKAVRAREAEEALQGKSVGDLLGSSNSAAAPAPGCWMR